MTTQSTAPARQDTERGKVTYQVAGQDVNLSYSIVKNYLTKGNGQVTDQDLTQFISICKYNQLNPFLNEAYLVKFGQQPAQMIVSKEALMKRAEICEKYEGIQAGIIVVRDGNVTELEGCFKLETDKLVGGWAKVYRSDRKFPIVSRVTLEEYDKKQSTWNEKKSTMISKVAKVQALREAFPTQLGAMYTAEERGTIEDVAFEEVKAQKAAKANKQEISIPDEIPQSNGNGSPKKPTEYLNVKSIDEAKQILINDFGANEDVLVNEGAIRGVALENGFEINVSSKGPGF